MKNLLFVHIPKTGGVSIYQHAVNCKIKITRCGHHEPAKSWNGDINELFSFAFVRNPYERFMSSYYFYKDSPMGTIKVKKDIQKYKTFKDFCLGFQEFSKKMMFNLKIKLISY